MDTRKNLILVVLSLGSIASIAGLISGGPILDAQLPGGLPFGNLLSAFLLFAGFRGNRAQPTTYSDSKLVDRRANRSIYVVACFYRPGGQPEPQLQRNTRGYLDFAQFGDRRADDCRRGFGDC